MVDAPIRKAYCIERVWNDYDKRYNALKIEDVNDDGRFDAGDQRWLEKDFAKYSEMNGEDLLISHGLFLDQWSDMYGQKLTDLVEYGKKAAQYRRMVEGVPASYRDDTKSNLEEARRFATDVRDQFLLSNHVANADSIFANWQELAEEVVLPPVAFRQNEFGLGGSGAWNSEAGSSAGLQAQWSGGWFNGGDHYGPLNVGEYTAQWSLGYGSTEGMFTGLKIACQAGIGMQFKPNGERGTDFYFMVTPTLGGEIFYNRPYATRQESAIGIESGFIGQIDDAVWMLSPVVQMAETANYQAHDGVMYIAVRSDFFQYGARARLIISEKLLASAEAFYMPNMSDVLRRDDGSGWRGSRARLSISYAFNDDWSVRGFVDHVAYVGSPVRDDGSLGWMQNANVTRDDFIEISGSVTLSRTF